MGNYKNYSETDLRLKYWLFRSLLYLLILYTIVFLSIGIITFSIGGNNELCTESVTATVIDSIQSDPARNRTRKNIDKHKYTYTPVYSYAYNGIEYSVESSHSTRPAKYSVGDEAVIMVNPDNPAEIYEPEFKEISMKSIIFIIVGVCGLLACIGDSVCLIKINKRIKNFKKSVDI